MVMVAARKGSSWPPQLLYVKPFLLSRREAQKTQENQLPGTGLSRCHCF